MLMFPVQSDRNFCRPSYYTFTSKHIGGYGSFKTTYQMLPEAMQMSPGPSNYNQYIPQDMAGDIVLLISRAEH